MYSYFFGKVRYIFLILQEIFKISLTPYSLMLSRLFFFPLHRKRRKLFYEIIIA